MSFLDKLKRDWNKKKPLVDTKVLDEYIEGVLDKAVAEGSVEVRIASLEVGMLKTMGGDLSRELVEESLDRLGVSRRRMRYDYGCMAYGWVS